MILYRVLLTLVMPALLVRLALRRLRGTEDARDAAERLGVGPKTPGGPVLWLHGASNGELASARALAEALLDARPDLTMVVTANTMTGRALARRWALPRCLPALAPLDLRLFTGRFLARVKPALLVVIENEFWPNRLEMARARGLPVVAAGARMSARTAAGWARFPALSRRLMRAITLLSPQDRASATRFVALGLPEDRVGPVLNLKAAVALRVPEAERVRLAPALPRDRTLLAASTHEGEEAVVLRAFAALHSEDPERRLILAPRHPRRADEIARMIAAAGLGHVRRSTGDGLPDAAHPVLLADTMGEMGLWYALAGTSFVGGSLVPKGGHTPYEPAGLGSAILTGPHVANAAEAFAALIAAGAAREVGDADSLAAAVRALDPAAQAAQAARARAALAATTGAAARAALVGDILALLPARRDR
ncbi:glycosyltransferase N-terminal domain-containing protein [Frigidibacter sp. MR17.14]|uniref:3-deoxy-D-manno-octulosonic acid transferase n=1 Tax=Frigidibacter sp. MR17.14 TaxID=3126509 RepID=UPI003012EA37